MRRLLLLALAAAGAAARQCRPGAYATTAERCVCVGAEGRHGNACRLRLGCRRPGDGALLRNAGIAVEW
jgi:hypothetical protein